MFPVFQALGPGSILSPSQLNSIWFQLTFGWAATPSKYKTFDLGMQFDSHRPWLIGSEEES